MYNWMIFFLIWAVGSMGLCTAGFARKSLKMKIATCILLMVFIGLIVAYIATKIKGV